MYLYNIVIKPTSKRQGKRRKKPSKRLNPLCIINVFLF